MGEDENVVKGGVEGRLKGLKVVVGEEGLGLCLASFGSFLKAF